MSQILTPIVAVDKIPTAIHGGISAGDLNLKGYDNILTSCFLIRHLIMVFQKEL